MRETKLKQKKASVEDWEKGIGALVKERISIEDFFGIEPLSKKQVVLDLGCGMGYHLDTFNCIKVGLDASKTNLIEAKKVSPKSFFVCGDANKLPFKKEIFDAVYSISVFHHLTFFDINTTVLVEVNRILKQRGIFMVEDSNSEGLIFVLPLVVFIMAFTRIIGHHSEGLGIPVKKTLVYLKNLGFKIIKAETKGSFFKWFLFKPEGLNPLYSLKKVILKLDVIFRRRIPPRYLLWYRFIAIKERDYDFDLVIKRNEW